MEVRPGHEVLQFVVHGEKLSEVVQGRNEEDALPDEPTLLTLDVGSRPHPFLSQ